MKKAVIIPLAIALVILLAFATTNAYRVPTADISFVEDDERPVSVATVEFEVSGLKCRGTARTFERQIQDIPGVVSFVAYSRTHTAIVEYDPALTDPDAIREAFEKPILHEGKTYEVFKMVSVAGE
ncbi:MAG: heavy-metal-associated domain-containing protein [Candidatus Eisenbacteria bacterium]|nr:heavy-metal-associated domain-containing protein [Candidatus Eisenbacteria bacterium]